MSGQRLFPISILLQPQNILFGTDLVFCLECPVKIGIISESAVLVHFRRRPSGTEHLLGHNQALLDNVSMDRGAHQPLKLSGQVVFTDEKFIGQVIQRQIFVVVLIDITQNIVNGGVLRRYRILPALLQGQPIQQHQHLAR